MSNDEIINDIENNLSKLLYKMSYSEYVTFIKQNILISFYDNNIDSDKNLILSNKLFLKVINKVIIKKLNSI